MPTILRIVSIRFEKYFGKFCELPRKISIIISKFRRFQEILRHFREDFGKFRRIISRNNSEIFDKYFGKFWKLYREISKTISKNFDINLTFLKFILKIRRLSTLSPRLKIFVKFSKNFFNISPIFFQNIVTLLKFS